jgi:hypothetical protein
MWLARTEEDRLARLKLDIIKHINAKDTDIARELLVQRQDELGQSSLFFLWFDRGPGLVPGNERGERRAGVGRHQRAEEIFQGGFGFGGFCGCYYCRCCC